MVELDTTRIISLPEWGMPLLKALYECSDEGILCKNLDVDRKLTDMLKVDRSTLWRWVEKLKEVGLIKICPGRKRGKYVLSEEAMSWFS